MQTFEVYWLAFKYWAGGTKWETALEIACKMVYWDTPEKWKES